MSHLGEQLTLNQWVLGSSPRWCTKECVARNCSAFFIALFQEGTIWCTIGDTRTGRRHASAVRNATVRRSLARGRVPDGAPRKAATDVAAFLLHHSLRDGFMLRLRLAFSSRGLVAKNAPPGHFLDAPTDGAPKNALHESVGRFFIALFQEGSIWCTIG